MIVHVAHLRVFEVLRVLGAELPVRDLAHDAVLVSWRAYSTVPAHWRGHVGLRWRDGCQEAKLREVHDLEVLVKVRINDLGDFVRDSVEVAHKL